MKYTTNRFFLSRRQQKPRFTSRQKAPRRFKEQQHTVKYTYTSKTLPPVVKVLKL